jgi:hypothetical protein
MYYKLWKMNVSDFLNLYQETLAESFICEVIKGKAVFLPVTPFQHPSSSDPMRTAKSEEWYITQEEEKFKLIGDEFVKRRVTNNSELKDIPHDRKADAHSETTGFFIKFTLRNKSIISPLNPQEETEIMDMIIPKEQKLIDSLKTMLPNPQLVYYG